MTMKKTTAARIAVGIASAVAWVHLTRKQCEQADADNAYEPGLAAEMVREIALDAEPLEDIADRYNAHFTIERCPQDNPKWYALIRLGDDDHHLEPIGSGHTPQEAVQMMASCARRLVVEFEL